MSIEGLYSDAVRLLSDLVKTPSFSTHEAGTADIIAEFLKDKGMPYERIGHNIIARNKYYTPAAKHIVLNSHHDTVKVVNGWTHDPHGATVIDSVLYGLGSNDAGASLVSLLGCFCHYYDRQLPYNLVMIASAEEENFGSGGIASVLSRLGHTVDLGIIGEPTGMHLAIAEKGLIVIDAYAKGVAGHAARGRGINALYAAVDDIQALKSYKFDKPSPVMGEVRVTVTQIESGYQHNVIPDKCHFVIDVRNTEQYTNEEVLAQLSSICSSALIPRSMKWRPSGISLDHPIVKRGIALGRKTFGSPTLSDQVHFTCPTIKIGPGESERSHTPDEFIKLDEIREGISLYIRLLEGLVV